MNLSYREMLEVFDGMIAGDGSVRSWPTGSSWFRVNLSGTKHADWLLYIKLVLEALGIKVSEIYPKVYHAVSKGKEYESFVLSSWCSPFLAEQRARWYPDGIKVIPRDCSYSHRWLAHLFMGDGNSQLLGSTSWPFLNVRLALMGFDESSIARIEAYLHEEGLAAVRSYDKRVKNGSGIVVGLSQESAEAFMTMVSPYMLPSFSYKIKYLKEAEN